MDAMRITVQLSPEITQALDKGEPLENAASDIQSVLDGLAVQLKPLHPGVDDEKLASYFTVDVADSARANEVLQRLRPCRGVQAAYMKPPAELA
jgi:hypothetical protein